MINQKGGPGGRSLTGEVNTLQFMAMMMIMINAVGPIPLFPANLLLETEDFEVCTFFIHRGSGSIFYLKSFFLCWNEKILHLNFVSLLQNHKSKNKQLYKYNEDEELNKGKKMTMFFQFFWEKNLTIVWNFPYFFFTGSLSVFVCNLFKILIFNEYFLFS